MSAPADCPIHPFDRYGLVLVESPVPQFDAHASAEQASSRSALGSMRWFEWGMLTGFAVIEISYLAGLAVLARWAVQHCIGT